MLDRSGQDFPMRFKHRSRARRRNVGVLDLLSGIHQVWPHRGKITGHMDVHRALFSAGRIKHMNRAELLIHDCVRPRRRRFNVRAVARQRLLHLLAAGVVDIQTHRAVAV